MKITMKLKRILVLAAIVTIPALSMAQPAGDDDVQDVPLDGGLSMLIAAGIGYGAKKALEKKKQANLPEQQS